MSLESAMSCWCTCAQKVQGFVVRVGFSWFAGMRDFQSNLYDSEEDGSVLPHVRLILVSVAVDIVRFLVHLVSLLPRTSRAARSCLPTSDVAQLEASSSVVQSSLEESSESQQRSKAGKSGFHVMVTGSTNMVVVWCSGR